MLVDSRTHPPRLPERLFAACGYFLPRLMFLHSRYAPAVHWGDIAVALDGFPCDDLDLGSPGFWDEWRTRWEALGDDYSGLAMESTTQAGRSRAWHGAAACYHWAEFMDFDNPGRKTRLRTRVRDCFQRGLDVVGPRMEGGELTVDGVVVPYWLVFPPAERVALGPLPCVVMSNGLDSMTEIEVLALAESYLDRGMAALLFDGPGQGIQVGRMPLRIDMEDVVAKLVDALRRDGRIAGDRLAFVGISFGGYLALRVAQALGADFRGVVNFSGGPRIAPFDGLPRRLKDDFRFAFQGGDAADMQVRFDKLAIDETVAVRTDVLSVHGALDDIFPLPALSALDRAWGSRHRLVVHEREAHVCLNRINTCAVRSADWLADLIRS